MKRWLTLVPLLVWVGIAGAQATPPMCSIVGNVANADGSPFVGVIKFFNPIVQVINNVPINPLQVSTSTNASGVIQPISLPQGAFFQVTICPSASMSSGCAATFTAIVPASASANFGNMAMGTNLTPSIAASSLSVSGTTSLASTTINSNPFTVGSGTQALDLTTGGTNPGLGPTQLTSFVGLSTKGPQLQLITPTSPPPTEGDIGAILWGSPNNPVGSIVNGASLGKVSAFINATTGGGAAPSGGLQFGSALGDGTTAQVRMEVSRDGTLVLPSYAQAGGFLGGPGTINVSKGYYINGAQLGAPIAWTPTIGGNISNPTVTYSTQVAYYGRIGQLFWYQFYVAWSAISGGSGTMVINGFPITPNGAGAFFQGVPSWNWGGINLGAGYTIPGCQFAPGNAQIVIVASGNNVGTGQVNLPSLAPSGQLLCEGWGST